MATLLVVIIFSPFIPLLYNIHAVNAWSILPFRHGGYFLFRTARSGAAAFAVWWIKKSHPGAMMDKKDTAVGSLGRVRRKLSIDKNVVISSCYRESPVVARMLKCPYAQQS